ncbi:hypothetical protein HN836_05375, partial [Candidatus Woesearchaeota archaeon]|nr:hypothetical protein [Candidatus Woesearchaeota archaeon]
SIKSIIKDFYEGDTQCLVPPYDTSVNSKEYLEDNVFPIILTKIFSDKGRAYNFSITYVKGGVEEPPFYSSQGNFDKQYSTIRKAAPFIIPMDNPQNKIIFNLITKTN